LLMRCLWPCFCLLEPGRRQCCASLLSARVSLLEAGQGTGTRGRTLEAGRRERRGGTEIDAAVARFSPGEVAVAATS
jgi:hypothetical protein